MVHEITKLPEREANIAPENGSSPKETHLPTINFQGLFKFQGHSGSAISQGPEIEVRR